MKLDLDLDIDLEGGSKVREREENRGGSSYVPLMMSYSTKSKL
jgi:hypothetical protein